MTAMLAFLGKTALKVPVLFVRFPAPALMLVVIAMGIAAGASSCVTHKLEGIARAELRTELENTKRVHAEKVADAAIKRADTIKAGADMRAAIDAENNRAWLAAISSLAVSLRDKSALDKLANAIKDLNNDPKFTCRREPLPASYLDSLSFPAWHPGDPE